MELPRTLESLHHHLGHLIEVLGQEQEALLHPSQEEDASRLHRLDQEKQQLFQSIEELEGECIEFRETLSAGAQAPADADDDLSLWRQVLELTDQAARLHQLNSTLIRHGLVHHQCVLNNLRRFGSPAPMSASEYAAMASGAPTAAEDKKPARKTRGRSKKAPESANQEH